MRRALFGVMVFIGIYGAPWIFGEHSISAFADAPVNPAFAAAAEQAAKDYQQVEEAFMANRMDDAVKLANQAMRQARLLSAEQRDNLTFIRKEAPSIRPRWWDQTKSSSSISFRASMWGKNFPANYKPSESIGMQAPVDYNPQTKRLVVVVTWRPSLVDSPKPLEGWLANRMNLARADMAEVIVWHELGHNYITLHLPAQDVIELYRNYTDLYMDVQEFYADLTALRHASPHAARTTLMFRLSSLYDYNDHEPHTRGATHGLGALMLSEFLSHPDDWPMVHWPAEVPADQVEQNTLIYIYEHFDTDWTLAEYKRLHDFIDDWVHRNGDAVLRRKGLVKLANGLDYRVLEQEDRDDQAKRDAWVAEKLAALIKDGHADKSLTDDEKRQQRKDHGPTVTNLRSGKQMFTGIMIPD